MKYRFEIKRTWHGAPLNEAEQAWVEVALEGDTLEVCWEAAYWPEPNPSSPPGECQDLWTYQAVELFLGAPGDGEVSYLELEFGPAGHWLAFEFSAYRQLIGRRRVHSYTWQVQGQRWTGRARVIGVPLLGSVSRGNAHFVHRCPSGRGYCSAHGDPGAKPDFHRADLFLPLDGGSLGRV